MKKMLVITLVMFCLMLVSPGLRGVKAQTFCILAGSKLFLVPNNTDSEFSDLAPNSTWGTSPCDGIHSADTPPYSTQGYLQDRMAYLLLDYDGPSCLSYPAPDTTNYNLHLQSTSTNADYWITGGAIDNWSMPDGSTVVVATLSVYKPSTGQVLHQFWSRAASPTYNKLYVDRKVADTNAVTQGLGYFVKSSCP